MVHSFNFVLLYLYVVITLRDREKAKTSTILTVGKAMTIERVKRKEAKNWYPKNNKSNNYTRINRKKFNIAITIGDFICENYLIIISET